MLLSLSVVSTPDSPGEGASVWLDESGGVVGRADTSTLVLPDSDISRHHAQITFQGGQFLIENLGLNGTHVNNPELEITEPVPLGDGDDLFIGKYRIRVAIVSEGSGMVIPPRALDEASGEEPGAVAPPARVDTPPQVDPGPSAPDPATVLLEREPASGATARRKPPPPPSAEIEELLRIAGVRATAAPVSAQQLGTILRLVVDGLIELLRARADLKSEFRAPLTRLEPVANNPLKFAADATDALERLLCRQHQGYLGTVDAFTEAWRPVASLSWQDAELDTEPSYLLDDPRLPEAEESVVSTEFTVSSGDLSDLSMRIVYSTADLGMLIRV